MSSLAQMSDADLLAALGQAPAAAPASTSPLSAMSDDDLLMALDEAQSAVKPDAPFGYGPSALSQNPKEAERLRSGLQAKADEYVAGPISRKNAFVSGVLHAADMAGLNLPGNLIAGMETLRNDRSFSENYADYKATKEAMGRQYPIVSTVGSGAGLVGGALASPVSSAATLKGRMLGNAAIGGGYAYGSELAGQGLDKAATGDAHWEAAKAGAIGASIAGATTPMVERAAAYIASRFAGRGMPYRNESGELTTTAKALLTKEGIDPASVDGQLDAALRSTFAAKGPTPEAVREASAKRFGIDLTRGQAADDYSLQQAENMMARGANGPEPQRIVGGFMERQAEQVAEARGRIGERFAGEPGLVSSPQEAAEMVANSAAGRYSQAGQVEARALGLADDAMAGLRGPNPIDALDAGTTVAQGVRDRAATAKAGIRTAYDDAKAVPGQFQPGAFDRIGREVREAIEAESVFVDPVLTPAANRALAGLDDLPNLRIGGVAPQPAGILGARSGPSPSATPAASPLAGGAGRVGAEARAPAAADSIVTPSGQRIGVEYRVVDAGELRTSHTADFTPDPAYPASLQPRDRSRAAAERQVQEIASDLRPEWLGASPSAREGAPIIGPDRIVESGNGRVMGIRRAYAEGGDSAVRYRDWLGSQGYDTSGMAQPVLVRVRTSNLNPQERVAFAQEANASAGLAMGAAEKAASDAQRLPSGALDLYRGGDVADLANRDFVRAFVQSIPKGEEGALVTKAGGLSIEGGQRLRNALLHGAYGDSQLVASLAEVGDDTIKAFGGVLQDIAPSVAKLRQGISAGTVAPGADLSRPLLEAAQLVQGARQRGLKLPEAVAQQDAFSKVSPETDAVLRLVYGEGLTGRVNRDRAVTALRSAISDAGQQVSEAGLFGQGPLSAADILTARAAKGSTADAVAARPVGAGTPSDPIRMSAEEFRAMQAGTGAAGAKPAAASVGDMTSGALDMVGVDQVRKRLNSAYAAAKASRNETDVRAVRSIIGAFDARVASAMRDGLFSGSDDALKVLDAARGKASDYFRTFGPQGAGDDVGRAMRAIVDRDAQPVEVANMIYGAAKVGNTGLSTRLADRLKGVLGADSPEWQAVQQGFVARVVNGSDMGHAAVANRIEQALTGQGRNLAYRVLTDEQVAGLRSFQRATRLAQTVRDKVPEWIGSLAKGNFEPQAIAASLYGRGTATGNKASAEYARAIQRTFGAESPEWRALRQGMWLHLTSKVEGSTSDYGSQAMTNRVVEFVNGRGKSLAQALYTPEELQLMTSFSRTTAMLVPKRVSGGSASPNSDTAPALLATGKLLEKYSTRLALALGFGGATSGGATGAAAGFAAGKAIGSIGAKLTERADLKRATAAVSGAPVYRPRMPASPVGSPVAAGVGAGVAELYQ